MLEARASSLLRALRVGIGIVSLGLTQSVACKATPRASASATPVGATALAPERVDPEYRDDLRAVEQAQKADPAGSAVVTAADRLLARNPPTNLRLAAVHAKVGHAYLNGDDGIALRWSGEALAMMGGAGAAMDSAEAALVRDIERLRAILLARSGEPVEALRALEAAERSNSISSRDLWAGRALAHTRASASIDAAFAFAMWRAEVADGGPEARYAEEQIAELLAGAEPAALLAYAEAHPNTEGASCLEVRAGQAKTREPHWIGACKARPLRIGVLLPRSGRLAALADAQLAAAVAAVGVLSEANPAVEVFWQDSGSTSKTAKMGAEALLERGVSVVVGPVGAGNVAAAERVLAGEAAVVVPGEGRGKALGIAPRLEDRILALVEHAVQSGATSLVVLAPAHSYGVRATAAARRAGSSLGFAIETATYKDATTSFAPLIRPFVPSLRKGAALLVLDRVARMELLLRQLAREGFSADGAVANTRELMVLTTAEALSLAQLGRGHELLGGVWMAPVAWPDPTTQAFVDAYTSHEGEAPGDQALLVFRALARAWRGGAGEPFSATVVRVQGGRIVAPPSSISLQTEG